MYDSISVLLLASESDIACNDDTLEYNLILYYFQVGFRLHFGLPVQA